MNWLFFFAFLVSSTCNKQYQLAYAYEVNMYITDTSGITKSTTPYLVYNDDLFEFIRAENYRTKINQRTGQRHDTITYDTLGCRLILMDIRKFIDIDSFKRNFQIKKYGPVEEILKNPDLGNNAGSRPMIVASLRDTIVKNVSYRICDTSFLHTADSEGMIVKMTYFFLSRPLNTLFKLKGMRHADSSVFFAGVMIEGGEGEKRQTVFSIVENIRDLPNAQAVLLQDIFEKARKQVGSN